MLYKICGWYTLIIYIAQFTLLIAKDGTSFTKYTGKFKLLSIIVQAPIYYFVIATLFFR